jgi:hypothetical protein
MPGVAMFSGDLGDQAQLAVDPVLVHRAKVSHAHQVTGNAVTPYIGIVSR